VPKRISKSKFKAHALELFRDVERTGQPLVITDRGRPVLRIVPFEQDAEGLLNEFKGMIRHYTDPLEPVGVEDWSALK
jgi:prevent-host-death family protein